MLATHATINPDDPASGAGQALFTINAGGYSATADAYARDPDTGGLWFLSMVGPQTALKAIWAALLKQPPEAAHIIKGVEGMALSGGYQSCHVPHQTIGTWTTRIARLPASRGWHALIYTRLAEFSFERDDFLLLAQEEADAPGLHHRFLDRRSPLPLHRSWQDWLWRRGLGHRRDSPAGVQRHPGLLLQPQGRRTQGGPVRRSGSENADPAGTWFRSNGGEQRWIGR